MPLAWRCGRWLVRGVVAGAVVLPLLLSLGLALSEAVSRSAWRDLLDDPQTWPALRASVVTAVLSTALAVAGCLLLVTRLWGRPLWRRVQQRLPVMLAVPHAAMAIGLLLLWMPGGWVARLLAPLAGWSAPPDWRTVNDPGGLALTLALALKELPFLLWTTAAMLNRPDVTRRTAQQLALGRSLGYPAAQVWWRVVWPQWLGALAWPVLAVAAYSLTVVDMALILGPATPPTLAVLAWQWLLDADPQRNAQGAAAACLLALLLVAMSALVWLIGRAGQGVLTRRRVAGPPDARRDSSAVTTRLNAVAARLTESLATAGLWWTYLLVGAALAVASVSGVWRFPALLPQAWSGAAWGLVFQSAGTVQTTALLALASSTLALGLTVAWLEATPPAWDRAATALALVPVLVPGLLLMVGVYRLMLALRLDGTLTGLVLVHTWMALPYVLVGVLPVWRRFDPRWAWVALSLGASRSGFGWRVKRVMLAAPLASAWAVGWAVSVAQYLPTLFVGAGRHATVTTEAVTLAAGGQRDMAAAYAVLQAALPLLGFGLAAWVGRRAVAVVSEELAS